MAVVSRDFEEDGRDTSTITEFDLDESSFRDMLKNESWESRFRLAQSPACPPMLLCVLAKDKHPMIRAAAALHGDLPLEQALEIVRRDDRAVRMCLASDTTLRVEVLEVLKQDVEPEIRDRANRTLRMVRLEQALEKAGYEPCPKATDKLGELLLEAGCMHDNGLVERLVRLSKKATRPLGQILVGSELLTVETVVALLMAQSDIRRGLVRKSEAIAKIGQAVETSVWKEDYASVLIPVCLDDLAKSGGAITRHDIAGDVMEVAPNGIMLTDGNAMVIDCNMQIEQILGIERRQIIGKQLSDVLDLSGSPKEIIDRHSNLFVIESATISGGKLALEISVAQLDFVSPETYVVFITDTTERKELEKRRAAQHEIIHVLASSSLISETLNEALEVLVNAVDWDMGEIHLVDEKSQKLQRAGAYIQPGSSERFRSERGATEYGIGQGLVGKVWAKQRPIWIDGLSAERRTSNGPEMMAFALPISVKDEFLGTLSVISLSIRRPDKDLLEMLTTTCIQVAHFVHRVKAEEEKQKQLLAAQRENFMASLAHDLKNPLVGLKLLQSKLLDGTLGPLASEQHTVISSMQESTQGLLALIGNLLSVYRFEAGVETLDKEPSDLDAIINTCLKDVIPVADTKNITFKLSLPQSLRKIEVDPMAIRRVIANLVNNAIKFSPNGGRIDIEVSQDDASTTVSIEDNGIGIKEQDLEYVFKRFWIGKAGETGTGIGLNLCAQIVNAHDGSITCTSREGHGTKFTFVLPV